jgi:demethylmenaquinone methyltransferase/2-methoxy-6-polyprenyl-1,4-benzoquinol methylase
MFDHFDFIAPWYDRIIRLTVSPRLAQALKLPHDGILLDAGGGTGRSSFHLRPLVSRLAICDFSLPMLKQAQAKGGMETVQARAEALPFRDGAFDRVMIVDALHHFFDQQEALHEFARVLKSGGRLVIEEPDRRHWLIRLLAVAEKMALMRSHIHRIPEIVDMLAIAGLTARIEKGNRFTSWVIADKHPGLDASQRDIYL